MAIQNSEAFVGIDTGHRHIHEGRAFTAQYSRTTAASNGHRSGLYFKTPTAATKKLHAVISFAASTAASFSICEAPTIAANIGTHANVPYNRSRDSAVASTVLDNATTPAAAKFTTLDETQIAADGTFNTGTVIRTAAITAGVGPQAAGGVSRETQEYILKANTAYIFLITNTAASANVHNILIDWYEIN